LIVGLLMIVGGTIFIINRPSTWYSYSYYFPNSDIQGIKDIKNTQVFAKGQVYKGKIV